MPKILIIDIETTGLDADKDKIIEFGAALCDWKTKKPVYLLSENIQFSGEIDPMITDLTGIETYMVKAPYAVPLKTAFSEETTPKDTVVAVLTPVGNPLKGIPTSILPSKQAVSPVITLACLDKSNKVIYLFSHEAIFLLYLINI